MEVCYIKIHAYGTTHSVIVIGLLKYFTVKLVFPDDKPLLCQNEMHSEKEHHNKEKYVVTLFKGNKTK